MFLLKAGRATEAKTHTQNDLNNPPHKESSVDAEVPESALPEDYFLSSPAHDELTLRETLASLYPPFRETGPVLLSQIDTLLENTFDGRLENFLHHFLLQAKPLLQWIREDAKNSLLNRECYPAILPEGV